MFNLNHVASVYSGRKGCACGCRGRHSYASQFRLHRPSYLSGDDGINDRSVRIITNRVTELLEDRNAPISRVMVSDDWIAVDLTHDRTYTIYFGDVPKPIIPHPCA